MSGLGLLTAADLRVNPVKIYKIIEALKSKIKLVLSSDKVLREDSSNRNSDVEAAEVERLVAYLGTLQSKIHRLEQDVEREQKTQEDRVSAGTRAKAGSVKGKEAAATAEPLAQEPVIAVESKTTEQLIFGANLQIESMLQRERMLNNQLHDATSRRDARDKSIAQLLTATTLLLKLFDDHLSLDCINAIVTETADRRVPAKIWAGLLEEGKTCNVSAIEALRRELEDPVEKIDD